MSHIGIGDAVHHGPSGENWVIARVEGEHVYPAGWPCGRALLADCTLIKKATDQQRADMIEMLRKLPASDPRHIAPMPVKAAQGEAVAKWDSDGWADLIGRESLPDGTLLYTAPPVPSREWLMEKIFAMTGDAYVPSMNVGPLAAALRAAMLAAAPTVAAPAVPEGWGLAAFQHKWEACETQCECKVCGTVFTAAPEAQGSQALRDFADYLHRLPDENGWEVGPMRVKFDAQGQLCAGPSWMGQDDTRRWVDAFLLAAAPTAAAPAVPDGWREKLSQIAADLRKVVDIDLKLSDDEPGGYRTWRDQHLDWLARELIVLATAPKVSHG